MPVAPARVLGLGDGLGRCDFAFIGPPACAEPFVRDVGDGARGDARARARARARALRVALTLARGHGVFLAFELGDEGAHRAEVQLAELDARGAA